MRVDVKLRGGTSSCVGDVNHIWLEAKFQVAVKGVERLFIPVPIEIIKFELAAVIQ